LPIACSIVRGKPADESAAGEFSSDDPPHPVRARAAVASRAVRRVRGTGVS
jgi:hypothetical protein